ARREPPHVGEELAVRPLPAGAGLGLPDEERVVRLALGPVREEPGDVLAGHLVGVDLSRVHHAILRRRGRRARTAGSAAPAGAAPKASRQWRNSSRDAGFVADRQTMA